MPAVFPCACHGAAVKPHNSEAQDTQPYESDPSRYKLSYAATADDDDQYSEELGKNIVRKNPHNDPSILNCRNCGCENIAHEIDVFGDHLEKGNDYFHRRLYDLAIIEYSKSSASILHSLK